MKNHFIRLVGLYIATQRKWFEKAQRLSRVVANLIDTIALSKPVTSSL